MTTVDKYTYNFDSPQNTYQWKGFRMRGLYSDSQIIQINETGYGFLLIPEYDDLRDLIQSRTKKGNDVVPVLTLLRETYTIDEKQIPKHDFQVSNGDIKFDVVTLDERTEQYNEAKAKANAATKAKQQEDGEYNKNKQKALDNKNADPADYLNYWYKPHYESKNQHRVVNVPKDCENKKLSECDTFLHHYDVADLETFCKNKFVGYKPTFLISSFIPQRANDFKFTTMEAKYDEEAMTEAQNSGNNNIHLVLKLTNTTNANDVKYVYCGGMPSHSHWRGPAASGGVSSQEKVKILGRTRNIVVQGRCQHCMYQGELCKLSELRKLEKRLEKEKAAANKKKAAATKKRK